MKALQEWIEQRRLIVLVLDDNSGEIKSKRDLLMRVVPDVVDDIMLYQRDELAQRLRDTFEQSIIRGDGTKQPSQELVYARWVDVHKSIEMMGKGGVLLNFIERAHGVSHLSDVPLQNNTYNSVERAFLHEIVCGEYVKAEKIWIHCQRTEMLLADTLMLIVGTSRDAMSNLSLWIRKMHLNQAAIERVLCVAARNGVLDVFDALSSRLDNAMTPMICEFVGRGAHVNFFHKLEDITDARCVSSLLLGACATGQIHLIRHVLQNSPLIIYNTTLNPLMEVSSDKLQKYLIDKVTN